MGHCTVDIGEMDLVDVVVAILDFKVAVAQGLTLRAARPVHPGRTLIRVVTYEI